MLLSVCKDCFYTSGLEISAFIAHNTQRKICHLPCFRCTFSFFTRPFSYISPDQSHLNLSVTKRWIWPSWIWRRRGPDVLDGIRPGAVPGSVKMPSAWTGWPPLISRTIRCTSGWRWHVWRQAASPGQTQAEADSWCSDLNWKRLCVYHSFITLAVHVFPSVHSQVGVSKEIWSLC